MNYFEARRERMFRNNSALMKLTKNVIKKNPEVEAYFSDMDFYPESVVFFLGEEINGASFHEVPFRWSGCNYTEHGTSNPSLEMPFTVEDVLTTFKPVGEIKKSPAEKLKTKKEYLNWYSYLMRSHGTEFPSPQYLLSPDGFTLTPDAQPHRNLHSAKVAFKYWRTRFEEQGYYSFRGSRIPLDELWGKMQWSDNPFPKNF
jgi:hypothetical protein